MSINLFLKRIHCIHPSPSIPLTRSQRALLALAHASSNAPSQAAPQNPNPNAQFALQYLIQSCNLSANEALKASKYIPHIKSPDKPDSVLRFLREIGIREPDIRAAILLDARILCSSVRKNWKPNIARLQELGFSIQVISRIIAISPSLFCFNFGRKVDFWLGVLGSVENLALVFTTHSGMLLRSNLENVLIPNLSFLKEHCRFSTPRLLRLIKSNPRLISSKPEVLKKYIARADALGTTPSSGTYLNALIIVTYLKQSIIDARFKNIARFGFSQEEVKRMVSRVPSLLTSKEEIINRKIEFLIKEAGCDRSDLVKSPLLLTYSLENRLMPRVLVWKLLSMKGIAAGNLKLTTIMRPHDEEFVNRYVWPYEHVIPGLYRVYADAGITGGIF